MIKVSELGIRRAASTLVITLFSALLPIAPLHAQGAGDILVVCGGVIPPQDHDALKAVGVAAVYGPGTNIPQAAREVIELIKAATVTA